MSAVPQTCLLLEDSEADVFLLRRQLGKFAPDLRVEVAGTREEYERLIGSTELDLILSDYRLPQYSGIEALMYARKFAPLVPFVFVTGALNNEELAADTILRGASGFVLKNNLAKLETLVTELLNRGREGATDPREPAAPEPSATAPAGNGDARADGDPALDSLMADLAGADPATLAKIRALLGK